MFNNKYPREGFSPCGSNCVAACQKINGTMKLPSSKSLSNLILLLLALSEGTTIIDNLLDSDDVHYMVGALNASTSACFSVLCHL